MKVFLCPSDASAIQGLTQYTNGNVNAGLGGTFYYAACNYAHNLALFANYSTKTANYYQSAYGIGNIPDGNSNTISFAERIGQCGPETNDWASTRDLPTQTHAQQNTSCFGDPVFLGEGPTSLPLPDFGVTQTTCTGKTASSAHTGVMVTGLMDGSVHLMSQGISQLTFWQLTNPADGQVVSLNW